MINQRAMAFAGTVLVLVLIGGWVVELARGNDGSPYSEVFAGGVVAETPPGRPGEPPRSGGITGEAVHPVRGRGY